MKYFLFAILILAILTPALSFGQAGQPACLEGQICNPLNGIDNLVTFVRAVLERIVLPIGAVVVVFFIIYSGYLFVTASGNEEKLDKAKRNFRWVFVGAAILLGAVVIAEAIRGTLHQIVPSL